MHRIAVVGEGGPELRVRGVVVALGRCRQAQGPAGEDRDGAALQRVDEDQCPLGTPSRVCRLAEQREHRRVEHMRTRLGVVQPCHGRHRRDIGGHRAGLGPPALLQIGPADGTSQTVRERATGLPPVERLVEGPGSQGGLVQDPRHDGERGETVGVVLGLGDQSGQRRDEGGSRAVGVGDGRHPGAQGVPDGGVRRSAEQLLDVLPLGLLARVVTDHRRRGERLQQTG